jgi:D-methionine transport system ATP-binding protein
MQPIIRVLNVSRSFSKNGETFYGLKEVSFEVKKGEIFGIIGQSGAGKSTLLRCMSSLEKPSSGKIWFEDLELSSLTKHQVRSLRKKIGMIFQHFHLLSSRTVAQNIALPMELASMKEELIEKKVDELLFLVGLTEKKHAYPANLSGGEKQRVGIARALALDPEVLFCDEATSALDPKMTKEILHLLKELSKKLSLTIVLITHQMEVIKQICNKVAVIDKGQIVEMEHVATLFSEPKHPITKHLLLSGAHQLPEEILKKGAESKDFLRLYFKGSSAKEPIISRMLRLCDVTVNILLGWIDSVEDTSVGTLTVEIAGTAESRRRALVFLKENDVRFEVLNNEL